MADIETNGSNRPLPYVSENRKSRVTRTRWYHRPEWMDAMKRPLRIIARDDRQYERFLNVWHLDEGECRRVVEIRDVEGVSIVAPLLVLEGSISNNEVFRQTSPLEVWKDRGGQVILVSEAATKNAPGSPCFTDTENLMASTTVQLAMQRHLDSINRQ